MLTGGRPLAETLTAAEMRRRAEWNARCARANEAKAVAAATLTAADPYRRAAAEHRAAEAILAEAADRETSR